MSRIYKDFLYNALYQIVRVIAPILIAPYIARVLGAESIGVYSYTHSVVTYFLLLAMLGVKKYGNREIARVAHDSKARSKVFFEIYTLQFFMTLVMMAAYAFYIHTIGRQYQQIALIQIFYLATGFFDVDWFLFGLQEFRSTAIRSTVIKLLSTMLIFVFVRTSSDLPAYTLVLAGGNLLSSLCLWPMLTKRVRFVAPQLRDVLARAKPNLMLFFPVVAVSIYKIISKILLGSMSTMTELGYYENSEKIITVLLGMSTAFGTIMLPRMTRMTRDASALQSVHLIGRSLEWIILVASAFTFGLIGIAPHFVVVFFGEAFTSCDILVSGLALTMLPVAWGQNLCLMHLLPNGRDKTYTATVCAGALINVALNLFLIPRFHALGAVIAIILTEYCVSALQTVACRRQLPLLRYFRSVSFYPFAGAGMAVILRVFVGSRAPSVKLLAVEILLGACVYLALMLIYGCTAKNSVVGLLIRRVSKKPGV
jgi:O-antigen/teichoic acid export membrane protein